VAKAGPVTYIDRMFRGKFSGLLPIAAIAPLLWSLGVGCGAAGGRAGDGDGDGDDLGGGAGPGTAGSNGPGSNGALFGSAADSVGCSQLEIGFEAQTPTVLIVVDRSSSQWDQYPNHTWEPMKEGILSVVSAVQADIRIGVVTYTGQNGGACPDLFPAMAQVTFDKNNLAAVEATLNGIDRPPYKGETPTAATIQAGQAALLADPAPGEKVILLVTDGDPDFCNDPDRACPMDAVVGAVQDARAKGISTVVFGLQRAELSEQHLRDVANAGAGQPVALPQGINSQEDLRNRCRDNPAGSIPGTYSPASGNAQFFQASGTDQAALGAALDAAIYGVRSCIFELDGAVEINPDRVGSARITLDDGAPLVFNDPNGWRLLTATQVELVGGACQQLKNPATGGIKFDFPCDVFSPR
jgi:Mg-chelatase subunit ChlD